MSAEAAAPKSSALKTALKWTFKIAVLGIGIGIGSEILTELMSFSYFHGPVEGQFIAGMAKDFFHPFFEALHLTGWSPETFAGVESWTRDFTSSVHGFFGLETPIHKATEVATHTVLDATTGTPVAPIIETMFPN